MKYFTSPMLAMLLALAFFACKEEKKFVQTNYSDEVVAIESKKANDFFDHSFDAMIGRDPEHQTYLSIKTNYDKWTDRSDSAAIAENEINKNELNKLRTEINFDKLDAKTKLSFQIF